MEYFENEDWIREKYADNFCHVCGLIINDKETGEKYCSGHNNVKSYTIVNDLKNFKKINDVLNRIMPSDLVDETKEFKKIYNRIKLTEEINESDREFFKLLLETLNHLYSNIGTIINNVYEISEKKSN